MATTEVLPAFSFEITGVSKEKALHFTRTHECALDKIKSELVYNGNLSPVHTNIALSDGQFTFEFTPTNLITRIVVKCRCGKEEDVTDYDSI